MTNFRELCDELLYELKYQSDWIITKKLIERASAALAEPEPERPTLNEIDDLCAEHSFCYENSESLECLLLIITDALARWGNRSTLQPIPVSERLPGPGDCDAEGRCWLSTTEVEPGWVLDYPERCTNYTHWLPAHALPQPS